MVTPLLLNLTNEGEFAMGEGGGKWNVAMASLLEVQSQLNSADSS